MKRTITAFSLTALFLIYSHATFAANPDFSGTWTLDRAASEGLPAGASQTMFVTQAGDKVTLEIIQSAREQSMQTIYATYRLDGREMEFTSKTPDGIGRGKRTAKRTADGIEVVEATRFEAPSGETTVQTTIRWSLSADAKTLKIETTVQNSSGAQLTKRVFNKEERPQFRIFFI